MKNSILILFTIVALLCLNCVNVYAGTFPDTDNHWADGDIVILKASGMAIGIPTMIDGREVNLFYPDKDATRAELARLLSMSLKLTQYMASRNSYDDALSLGRNNVFSDVQDSDWFCLDTIIVNNAKIMKGYPNGKFLPNQPVTREETAQIISNYIDYINKYRNEQNVIKKGAIAEKFVDDNAISNWAKPAVYLLPFIQGSTGNQVMNGYPDGTFKPQYHLTRGEAATLLVRLAEVRG
ncbi:MAG: S-layer homology domain-containing protein [Bacillota bacterium]|nr:S-layer homology domain-containing protein [Bacillota bacterium]